jgi:hypothetical protein
LAKTLKHIVPFICLWLIFTVRSAAQEYIIQVQHFGLEEGLSHRNVHFSLQDRRGLMWFGTDYGLNRFDGYHFKWITKEKHGLHNNAVVHAMEDPDGFFWIFYGEVELFFGQKRHRGAGRYFQPPLGGGGPFRGALCRKNRTPAFRYQMRGEGSGISLFPNPAGSNVILMLDTDYAGDAVLTLYDLTGKQMKTQPLALEGGAFRSSIELAGLPAGAYLAEVQAGRQQWRERLVVE